MVTASLLLRVAHYLSDVREGGWTDQELLALAAHFASSYAETLGEARAIAFRALALANAALELSGGS